MIDHIQISDIRGLAGAGEELSVSIFVPTHRRGPEIRQDAIRLRNATDKAVALLEEAGVKNGDLHKRVSGFADRVDNKPFWDHQGDGLAVFFREGSERMFRLPREVGEQVYVANEFLVRPLIPQRGVDQPYWLVALTWDDARLLQAGTESIEELETAPFPFSRTDLVAERDPEEQLQYNSYNRAGNRAAGDRGGSAEAMYHGHGQGEQKIDADREHYLKGAVDRISEFHKTHPGPTLLMATEEVVGHLPERARDVIGAFVHGSPSNASAGDLLKRTRDAANELLVADESKLLDNLGTALSNQRGSKNPTEILNASFDGRIDTLILSSEQTLLGTYDVDSRQVKNETPVPIAAAAGAQGFARQAINGNERDLSNLAAIQTILGDGDVLVAEQHKTSPLSAIFRY